ncbi:MAG: hypothetical protein WCC08_16560 [Terrimicrobiaceae bacterium]
MDSSVTSGTGGDATLFVIDSMLPLADFKKRNSRKNNGAAVSQLPKLWTVLLRVRNCGFCGTWLAWLRRFEIGSHNRPPIGADPITSLVPSFSVAALVTLGRALERPGPDDPSLGDFGDLTDSGRSQITKLEQKEMYAEEVIKMSRCFTRSSLIRVQWT